MIASFEKKAARNGTPEIVSVAMKNVQYVRGIFFARPPMRRMSCSPPIAWITEPAPRKRQALKKACVVTWNMPSVKAPTPQARNM